MTCYQCGTGINVRNRSWHDYDGRNLCSLLCVYRYRGNQPGRKLV